MSMTAEQAEKLMDIVELTYAKEAVSYHLASACQSLRDKLLFFIEREMSKPIKPDVELLTLVRLQIEISRELTALLTELTAVAEEVTGGQSTDLQGPQRSGHGHSARCGQAPTQAEGP